MKILVGILTPLHRQHIFQSLYGWCQPVRQELMENECEALPGVAYPRVRDNRSTINTKTGYDDDDIRTYLQDN